MGKWQIHSAYDAGSHHPFESPQPGDVARLRASSGDRTSGSGVTAEIRIRVEDRDSHGMFHGQIVAVEPAIPGLVHGMWIAFGAEHIATLEGRHPSLAARLKPRPDSLLAVCSRRVAVSPRTATTIVRVKPRNARDSGLRLLADGETLDRLSRGENAAVCRLPWLLQHDPTLALLRKVGVGARFERDHPGQSWQRVEAGTRNRVPVT